MRQVATRMVVVVVLSIAGCGDREQEKSMAELIAMLQNPDSQVQIQGLSSLMPMGPKAAEAVPALLPLLKNSDPTVRSLAVRVVGDIGPDAKQAIPTLADILRTTDPELFSLRSAAADALAKMGPDAAIALPALQQFAQEPDACNSAKNAIQKLSER